ncbi:MAG: hypothetical protein ACI4M6_01220 [Christensenellaceae bacterium]
MFWQDKLSIIGVYILLQVFIFASHLFAVLMDHDLYELNKFNENRKTIRIGIKWIFWRCKKHDKKEIFTIAFIHEVISLFLFIATTILFIVTLVLNEQIIMYICFLPILMYLIYCSNRQRIIKLKARPTINDKNSF